MGLMDHIVNVKFNFLFYRAMNCKAPYCDRMSSVRDVGGL